MKGAKHSNYLWVADNNWINFAEKWMCFDALVADWQSAGFSSIYHSPFICCCQTFPQPPFQCRLIKQLFNKTKRHLHSQRTEQGFTEQRGESRDEYQLTPRHAFLRWEVWHSIGKIRLLSGKSGKLWFTRPQLWRETHCIACQWDLTFQQDVSRRWFVCHNSIHTLGYRPPLMSSFKSIGLSFALSKNTHGVHKDNQWIPLDTANQQGFILALTCWRNRIWSLSKGTPLPNEMQYFFFAFFSDSTFTQHSAHWALPDWRRLMAAGQHGQTTLQWQGSRCCQKQARHVLPPCPRIKLMPCSLLASSPAAACPCGYREVNKL